MTLCIFPSHFHTLPHRIFVNGAVGALDYLVMFSKFRSYRFNLIEIQLASIKNAPVVYMLEIPPGGEYNKMSANVILGEKI